MPISKAYSTGNKPNETVSVADFGAVGDGVTDDTVAIINAVKSGAGVVVFPPANYLINAAHATYDDGSFTNGFPVGIPVPSNTTLLGYGATLTTVNTNAENYSLIASFNTSNVHVKGFTLVGDKNDNTSNPALPNDYGFGVDFRDVTNCSVEDVESYDMWGDSFYCGVTDTAGTGSNGVVYRNIYGHDCRRQGLSITGGNSIKVIGYRFEDIDGAVNGPGAGIDIEPNTTDLCDDIQLINGITKNCNYPIDAYKVINLVIDNLQTENCNRSFPRLNDRVYDANLTNIIARAGVNTEYGILWQNSKTLIRVSLADCQINGASIATFIMTEDTGGSYEWYDVKFDNVDFYVTDGAVFDNSISITTPEEMVLQNCKFIVPDGFDAADTSNLPSGTNILGSTNAIWQNSLFIHKGTASIKANFSAGHNRGNLFPSLIEASRDTLSLQNSWVTATGYQEAVYAKNSSNEVAVYGTISGGTTTSGTLLFTLPVGFRPLNKETCVITIRDGAAAYTAESVDIDTNGQVTLSDAIPGNNRVGLNGIRFMSSQ